MSGNNRDLPDPTINAVTSRKKARTQMRLDISAMKSAKLEAFRQLQLKPNNLAMPIHEEKEVENNRDTYRA